MKTLPLPGGYERFSERSDVIRAQDEIHKATQALNDSLSYASGSYDGVVSFGHEPGEALAIPLANANAYDTAPERYEFRTDNIIGRRLLVAKTALQEALKPNSPPRFDMSAINPLNNQFVYTQPLAHDGRTVGALQYSFTPESPGTGVDLLENEEMSALHRQHRSEVQHIADQTARLQRIAREAKGIKSLATGLELEQPIAPNAFVIRWDIKNSTHFVHSDLGGVYDAFVGQVHAFLRELTYTYTSYHKRLQAGIHEAYDDQGDGAYIVLPLPEYFSPYLPQSFATFKQHYTRAFMQRLHEGIEAIAHQYDRTFTPAIAITADFGYVEENTIGRLTSRTMHTLANQQKEK
ncbi:hypothetical protein BGO18_01230 [Candidatus Saccharibacteria bacterium 47-87]|nr:hypothetical protein [Candidatus Saccharibacteria bacterium]OJU96790.1 MAG: hypothetical protein BGO18_01230 [Candidatus Saccharibacteria bacterium 47-87]